MCRFDHKLANGGVFIGRIFKSNSTIGIPLIKRRIPLEILCLVLHTPFFCCAFLKVKVTFENTVNIVAHRRGVLFAYLSTNRRV